MGLLAFGISPQATDVQRFINWMKAIRSSTQVTEGSRDVFGTVEVLQRFVDALQAKVATGDSEYVVGIEAILPHLVYKKELSDWFLSDSTNPARPENLYVCNILGGLYGVWVKGFGGGFFSWAVGAFFFCGVFLLSRFAFIGVFI